MALTLDTRQRAMLQEMGVRVWLPGTALAVAEAAVTAVAGPAAPALRAAGVPAAPAPVARDPLAPALGALASADWVSLRQAAASCQACSLCAGRKNSTLLAGAGAADWMVVGDPPDMDEDAAGAPFATSAGVLLDNMLAALGLRRSNRADASASTDSTHPVPDHPGALAYVTNVVKCRPPHGTPVQPADLAQCAAYLQREIALVQPKVIVAMGRFATQLLLGDTPELANQPLGKLRGVVRHYGGIAVVPTYHPQALMRNSADKAKAWVDLCLAADTLEALRQLPPPAA